VDAACNLHSVVKVEGLLKVTGSHVHWKVIIFHCWKQC